MRKTRLLLLVSLLTVAAVGGVVHTTTEQQHLSVESNPADDRLSREDEVIVRNASEQLATDLELIVHRVDELRGGNDQIHRIVIHVGGMEDHSTSAVSTGGSFVNIGPQALSLVGFRGQSSDSDLQTLAVTSMRPGSRNVSIYLPTLSRLATLDGPSYEFVLAHELGHIPLRSREVRGQDRNVTRQITTDYILARRAISEGVATRVGVRYTERYGGSVDPSVFQPDDDGWRSRALSAVYFEGYRYASSETLNSTADAIEVNSTAAVLHPNESISVAERPEEPFGERFHRQYERVFSDRVGELLIRELLVSRGIDRQTAATAAAGWRNGRLDRYVGGGRTVTAWTTVWENQTERRAFLDAYREAVTVESVEQFDTERCGSDTRYVVIQDERVVVFRCN